MIIPIRMEAHEELIGADFFEHDIRHPGVGVSRAVSVLKHFHENIDVNLEQKGYNKGINLLFQVKNNDSVIESVLIQRRIVNASFVFLFRS